ncbi:MAG: ATP synthase F0 subunit B [Caldimicrobium sp.]|jgi:F-type H+-transporting ATPase subunit b|nr:ATP synthase F0 subunit B [Caldimicrobium sp.]
MKVLASLFLILSFLVQVVYGAEEGHHGITPTQVQNLIWWTVNFIALLIILFKLLRKPLVNFLQNRKETIQREYEELLRKKREAEAQYLELQAKLKNMEDEAKQILQNYIEQGQKEKERIIKEAEEQAKRIMEQADLYIKHELEKAKEDLRKELAQEVIKLTEERLLKGLTIEDHKRIFQDVVESLRSLSIVKH